MSTAFSPDLILKDLSKLWIQSSNDQSDKNGTGLVRACTMTFIVAMEETEDSQEVGQIVAELMHENPSRAVLLRVGRDEALPDSFSARVLAQCWLPFGQRQQICCEQIEITSPRPLLSDVPKLMLSLTVPDLPVVLYVRSPSLVTERQFQDLFSVAHKIVIDSEKFDDPEIGYSFLGNAYRFGRNITDLAWTRLTRLRQLVAQLCENELCNKYIREVKTIKVSYASPLSPVAARYLGSWFHHALPAAELVLVPDHQTEIALTGPGVAISVTIADKMSAILRVNDFIRTAPLPKLSEQELLREELSILGPDPVFRRCFN